MSSDSHSPRKEQRKERTIAKPYRWNYTETKAKQPMLLLSLLRVPTAVTALLVLPAARKLHPSRIPSVDSLSSVLSNTNRIENDTVDLPRRSSLEVAPHLAQAAVSMLIFFSTSLVTPTTAVAMPEGSEGLPAVTQSELGKSIRKQIVQSAQVVDRLDLQWERFSDSLRDEAKCDTRTNRRMFDNGFRRDGTRIGNPVLGALCTPEPLRGLDDATADLVLDAGAAAATDTWKVDPAVLQQKLRDTQDLVAPSFDRALVSSVTDSDSDSAVQQRKRQEFNRDLYISMRSFGDESIRDPTPQQDKGAALRFDLHWGEQMLTKLAPGAGRNDFSSPFPKPDESENQPYDESALLDALGSVSVALQKLQQGGLVGHWEISIPEDDDWNVVTIAVDDDISIGGQILGRERKQPLAGSAVIALVRSAMESQAKISYKLDTFFVDPSTTRQELYNPTQLLLSLSDLGQ